MASQSHVSVCEENAGTISSSKPCAKAFDGILVSSSYWTTTNSGVGSWLKVHETKWADKHTCQHAFNIHDAEALVFRDTLVNAMTGVLRTYAVMIFTVYNVNVLAFNERES